MRTIKRTSHVLNKQKYEKVEKLCKSYSREKNSWLDTLKSWDYQSFLGMPRKIRDQFVDRKYVSRYGMQARHWKLALQDAAETWDKYWQSIFVKVRSKISSRKTIKDEERHYAFWLLKGYQQFAEMMKGKAPKPNFEILTYPSIAGYVRRLMKKNMGKPPRAKKSKSAKFDSGCYSVFEHKGVQYLKLMSLESGKRIVIPLKGKGKIEGNITIVANEQIVAVHISKELKKRKSHSGPIEAVDFGYSEVMTDTEGARYGTKFGELLTKATDSRHEKMQKRQRLHHIQKKDDKKAKRILKYNLGRYKLKETAKKTKAALEVEINTGINTLLKKKRPSILITEDLRHHFTYNNSKKMNRKLSAWVRGKLQDRVSFKALAEGFRHEQVNPAYGSQSCPSCDFVDHRNRKGDKFKCLHCAHEDMADRAAALNYLRRFGDGDIGRYMPYSQVKTMLLNKFHRRLETGKPVTVPGRTLETASDVSLQQSVEITKRSQPGEKISLNRAVTQRAKQNKHVLTRF